VLQNGISALADGSRSHLGGGRIYRPCTSEKTMLSRLKIIPRRLMSKTLRGWTGADPVNRVSSIQRLGYQAIRRSATSNFRPEFATRSWPRGSRRLARSATPRAAAPLAPPVRVCGLGLAECPPTFERIQGPHRASSWARHVLDNFATTKR
jgi:hypothetical protein